MLPKMVVAAKCARLVRLRFYSRRVSWAEQNFQNTFGCRYFEGFRSVAEREFLGNQIADANLAGLKEFDGWFESSAA